MSENIHVVTDLPAKARSFNLKFAAAGLAAIAVGAAVVVLKNKFAAVDEETVIDETIAS